MSENELVRMANQIADFYKPYPHEEAIKGVSEHITMFWEPRMKQKMRDHLTLGGEGLSQFALDGAKAALNV